MLKRLWIAVSVLWDLALLLVSLGCTQNCSDIAGLFLVLGGIPWVVGGVLMLVWRFTVWGSLRR